MELYGSPEAPRRPGLVSGNHDVSVLQGFFFITTNREYGTVLSGVLAAIRGKSCTSRRSDRARCGRYRG